MAMDTTKPTESQELQFESEATESSVSCSECFKGQQVNINAMNVTDVNVIVRNNRTAVIGDKTQLNICEGGLHPCQLHNTESKSGVFADGNDTSCHHGSTKKTKKRRRKRKKPSEVQTALKCDEGGNSADGENSDSDHSDKFGNFLQCDSDD